MSLCKLRLCFDYHGSVHVSSLALRRFLDVIPDHSLPFGKALTISFTSSEVRVLPLAKSLLGYSLPG